MERLDTWVVTKDDERPARQDGTCFYCHEPIGGRHKPDCVIPEKSVLMNFTITLPVIVPVSWDKDMIEHYYNLGSWCGDNLLSYLERWHEKTGRCLCSILSAQYLRDATKDEDKDAV